MLDKLKRCLVGYHHYLREAHLVQTSFFMEGFKGVTVTAMGDNMVLLQRTWKEGWRQQAVGRRTGERITSHW